MFPYDIDDHGRFVADGVDFHIDLSPKNRRLSEPGRFTIVKNKPYLDIYGALAQTVKPSTILELGIFQGGSYVLMDKLFKPARMSALDIAAQPVGPLVTYCQSLPGRTAYFATSQTDELKLNAIVDQDLGGVLDMVVDDASHTYDLTRRSFEILFPRLSPGGCYIIEDWGWSHMPSYQGPEAPWSSKPALTNFIFDLIVLQGSTAFIREIRVLKPLVVVRKSHSPVKTPVDFMKMMALRDRALAPTV